MQLLIWSVNKKQVCMIFSNIYVPVTVKTIPLELNKVNIDSKFGASSKMC